jgi:hypothetical protein
MTANKAPTQIAIVPTPAVLHLDVSGAPSSSKRQANTFQEISAFIESPKNCRRPKAIQPSQTFMQKM